MLRNRRFRLLLIFAVAGVGLILPWLGTGTAIGAPQQLPRPELSGVIRFPPQVPREVRAPSDDPQPALGTDVNTSNNGSPQNETAAAVDPTNPNHVVAAANDYRLGDASCGFYNSINGGGSWSAQMLPRLIVGGTTNAYDGAGDPSVAVDVNGVARVGCLHFERNGEQQNAIVVHTVTFNDSDNIATVASEKVIESFSSSVFHDKPYIAVGPGGAVYISWTEFSYDAAGNYQSAQIRFAYKASGASGFTILSSPVSDNPDNQGSVPVVSGGYVYVAWLNYTGAMQIRIDKAAINPATGTLTGGFGTDVMVRAITPIPSPFTGQNFRINSFPTLAAGGGNLYLAWAQRGSGSDEADIAFSRSTDGGTSWSTPLRVNSDNTTRDQFFPWMAVDGSGKIHLIWYDKREDGQDKKFHTFYARLTVGSDGTVTVGPNQRASDRVSNPSGTDQFGGRFIGDYNGIGAGGISTSGSTAYPVFMAYRGTGPNGKFADQEVYSDKAP